MTDIIKRDDGSLEPKKPMTDNEIAEARKKFLVQKYFQKDVNVDLSKLIKFGVFKLNIDTTGTDAKMELVAKCDNQDQALEEIRWRAQFHHRPDNDIVMKNDKRFEHFSNETNHVINNKEVLHGDPNYKSTDKYLNHELDYTGDYFIYPIYEIT